MPKISNYTQVSASKLADKLVCDQEDSGVTSTKSVSVEQMGDVIAGAQSHADLNTSSKNLIGAINEVEGEINSPLVSKTHCKYIQLPSKLVFIIVDGATNGELLDIPAPSSTQYFAGLSQSNTYASFSLSSAKKVTIITSGVTAVYGNFVYYSS